MPHSLSYQVAPDLYLNRLVLDDVDVPVAAPTCHNCVLVVDCSGSMRYDLDKVRAMIKTRIVSHLREGDTLSLVWFSGRGEHGPILEAATIATMQDLARVTQVVDRWLQPHGLTGFVDPLREVGQLIDRVS